MFPAYGAVVSLKREKLWCGECIGKEVEPDADLGLQRVEARCDVPKLRGEGAFG